MSLSHRESSDRGFIALVLGLFAVVLLGLAWWQSKQAEPNLPAPTRTEPRPATLRPAPPSLAAPPPAGVPTQAAPDAIYRCQQAGRVIYQDSPCSGGQVVLVQHSAGVSLPRASSRAESDALPQAKPALPPSSVAQEPQACQSLVAYIRSLDARARQRLASSEQDRLREERRNAFDRWTELKCHSPIE